MTDEGGPPRLDGGADNSRVTGAMGLTPLNEKPEFSKVHEVAAARTTLEKSAGGHRTERDARAALWNWDLANGRMEWNDRLKTLFGYAEVATDAAWRVNRIHPEDRDRVEASLQRATIANLGEVWSDQYRFRQADGSYAAVTERAYVVHDDAGPRGVLGAITPAAAVVDGT
jgi:PAS domain S-box-containing protein